MRTITRFLVHTVILGAVAFVVTGCCCGLPIAGGPGGFDDLGREMPAPRAEIALK